MYCFFNDSSQGQVKCFELKTLNLELWTFNHYLCKVKQLPTMQPVIFKDLGLIDYKSAWDYQEKLLQQNLAVKSAHRNDPAGSAHLDTENYFLLCEHAPVYTLGKSG